MPSTPELWKDIGQINIVDPGTGADFQFAPKVVHLTNGNILYAWTSNADSGAGAANGDDVIGRIYDSLGNAVTGEFRLNNNFSIDDEADADIAALPGGGFVVVYVDTDDPNTDETLIRLDQWSATGTFVTGTTITTDGTDSDTFRNPSVAVSSDSAVLVSWEHVNPDSDGTLGDVNVQHVIYNAITNSVGSTFTLFNGGEGADEGISGNAVAALSNGNYVLVYGNDNAGNDAIEARILNSAGGQAVSTITVADGATYVEDPHVVGLTGGGFVVVYEISASDPPTNSGLRARVFDNLGATVAGFLIPATTTPGNQRDGVVAALADGGFVIAWIDNDTRDIHGQRYNATGTKVGVEFDMDTNIGNLDFRGLDIEGLDDGRFVVTWEEGSVTGPNIDVDVRSAIFDPRDDANSPAVYTDNKVIGTIGNDTIAVDPADENVFGHDGNDTFSYTASVTSSVVTLDGGAGSDRILINGDGTVDLSDAEIVSIEEIEFAADGGNQDKTVILSGGEFDSPLEFSPTLLIDGNNASGSDDTVIVNLDAATNFDASGWTFSGWSTSGSQNDRIIINGTATANTIIGSSEDDIIEGGDGADSIDGGAGIDTASYAGATAGVRAELAGPANNTGEAAGDTYTSIENLIGSDFNDRLEGDAAANILQGGGGDDRILISDVDTVIGQETIDGGTGTDTLDFVGGDVAIIDLRGSTILSIEKLKSTGFGSSNSRTLQLDGSQFGTGGIALDAEFDPNGNAPAVTTISVFLDGQTNFDLSGITFVGTWDADDRGEVTGTSASETITGTSQVDVLSGGDGNDIFIGGTGADTFNGGDGLDTVSYANEATGVTVDFFNSVFSGAAADETFLSIEAIIGTDQADVFHNVNIGIGGAGDDTFFKSGSGSPDSYDGGAGTDLLDVSGFTFGSSGYTIDLVAGTIDEIPALDQGTIRACRFQSGS